MKITYHDFEAACFMAEGELIEEAFVCPDLRRHLCESREEGYVGRGDGSAKLSRRSRYLERERREARRRCEERERSERERMEADRAWRRQKRSEHEQSIQELRAELHTAVARRDITATRFACLGMEKDELALMDRFG